MFCSTCVKLAYLHTKKNCIRCQGEILNSISILCDFCSTTEKICAACLKKVSSMNDRLARVGGCGACRGKS